MVLASVKFNFSELAYLLMWKENGSMDTLAINFILGEF